CQHHAESPLTF
nr:immunoglobulin light chain junction region [Macaca mulatta]MOX86671.1 immunoglobulin light chain junction region [Macaca mulatta]MOX87569.1 immunoglobulin light chain junction region [Macaca mulatta]MOX87676.1 immunoglobulin light chain junction region [Macaca mulatta]MOX88322.1 immunoglobulin light chain junction region [Macaca mulatta]